MQNELTNKIKEWLDSPSETRDVLEGATLLLRINRNRIFYENAKRNPDAYAARIAYELKKIYSQRLQAVTKQEIGQMLEQVEAINKARGLDRSGSNNKSKFQRGHRADHDELPEEIRRLFDENGQIMAKMRECHVQLRMINESNSSCPDNDRWPWAKEILALDKKYRENFYTYDHYKKGDSIKPTSASKDKPADSKYAVRFINLHIGRYVKTGDSALGERLKELYSLIANPSSAITEKMQNAGLL